ncbi:Bug family tripartite tricarboxylate transporter substrate binding protein [Aestuariirhabdus litorea]|uniref:Tripartite tricarboxylate transporter substrate binding protein n=1 Tax=Aestuariirhabdus litorea TaxID=2528527 RepID=A0A3P3VNL3_9GAMM|nr:tripartite tricarboxylate transporter substrate-binding protein [Aestuariirhabdus litorea]RRJ84200.1 tripartite tricarboxylate transporter substrate binding protein [Aestuariirhabdus litorea]RWW97420.1 tripartite tricarboxylate transporter substrate binding protein [Endozoicomonadaceae bacterium GTF-13]
MTFKSRALALALGLCSSLSALAYEPSKPGCIAPAKPGGGFDLTCRIVSNGFADAGLLPTPMAVTFMPGGVGAVAYNHINANRRGDNDTLVAFSSGSLLNIAQGKFGQALDENSVRWVGAAGVDYGAIIVKADAPWNNLADLVKAVQADPTKFVLGAGGGVGSQDWMKAAILMKSSGVDPKKMRYVAYEGGGEAIAALLGGHIQIYPGDVGEMVGQLEAGKLKMLGVMAPERLDGEFSAIPTAKEQGFDAEWAILRGFYMGPEVSDEAYQYWAGQFAKAYQSDQFLQVVADKGLLPFKMQGEEFDALVKQRVGYMRELAREAGLIK